MRDIFESQLKYYQLERDFEWQKWAMKIPAIQFPSHWHVKIVPPLAAAMIRFRVSLDGKDRDISVYLDCYETLGCWNGEPYWEIYPASNGDTERFDMADIKCLIEGIEKALKEIK
jgi:hypothetical protein